MHRSYLALLVATAACAGEAGVPVEDAQLHHGTLVQLFELGPDGAEQQHLILRTEDANLRLEPADPALAAELRRHAGEQIALRGERAGGVLRAAALDEPEGDLGTTEQAVSVSAATGSFPYLVVACHFSDKPVPSLNRAQGFADQIAWGWPPPGVNHYYRTVSNGRFNLDGTRAFGGIVTLSSPSTNDRYWSHDASGNRTTMDAVAIGDDCYQRALALGVSFSGYRGRAWLLDQGVLAGFSWGTPGGQVWFDQSIAQPATVIHEIGHGLGFNHAASRWDPLGYSAQNPFTGKWCSYGSKFDPMGGMGCDPLDVRDLACYPPYFNAYHRMSAGWSTGQQQTAPLGTTTYVIARNDTPPGSTATTMVNVPIDTVRFVTVEARRRGGIAPDGSASYEAKIPQEGIVLHFMEPNASYWETWLLDEDSDCDSTDSGAVLTVGERFFDKDSGVSIEVTAATADGYQVRVSRPGMNVLSLTTTDSGYIVTNVDGELAGTCRPGRTCGLLFPNNSSIKLTAKPINVTGAKFVRWEQCPSASGTTCTFLHDSNRSIKAVFTCGTFDEPCFTSPSATLKVTMAGTVSGGVLSKPAGLVCTTASGSCSKSYPMFDAVTLYAFPADPRERFQRWEDADGSLLSWSTRLELVLTSSRSIRAVFGPLVDLSITKKGAGTGKVTSAPAGISCGSTCTYGFVPGTMVTLHATATAPNAFAGWSGGGCSGYGDCTVRVDAATTVSATFVADLVSAAKPAAQSSDFGGAPASNGNDGKLDTYQQTLSEFGAWWKVDLVDSYLIRQVEVYNRADCCADRLTGFYVDLSYDGGVTFKETAQFDGQAGYPTVITLPSSTIASQVRIRLKGTNTLHMGEVRVFGRKATLLSQGKPAWQSSTWPGSFASYAVDGDPQSLASTDLDAGAWWMVDLGSPQTVKAFQIWNRWDCCADRLKDFYIEVSPDGISWPVAIHVTGQAGFPTSYFMPSAPVARYVRIRLAGTSYLTTGEVRVWTY